MEIPTIEVKFAWTFEEIPGETLGEISKGICFSMSAEVADKGTCRVFKKIAWSLREILRGLSEEIYVRTPGYTSRGVF